MDHARQLYAVQPVELDRPCRLIHISFTVSSTVNDAEKVAQLAAFSRKWMDANEKVDPSSYKKSVVVDVKNGVKLEAIFYPLPVSIHIHCVKHTSLPSSKQRNALVSQWYPMNCLRRFPKMGLVEPLTRWSLWTCWHTKTRIPRYLPDGSDGTIRYLDSRVCTLHPKQSLHNFINLTRHTHEVHKTRHTSHSIGLLHHL